MAAVTEDGARRLGAAVREARERRRLTQTELAEAVGVSLRTIGNVERGETAPQVRHRAALEEALHWTAGSVRRVLEGGEPTVTEENSGPEVQVDRPSVTGGSEDGAYVADRGPDDPPGRISDDELLAVIRRQRQELDELERRIRGDRPMEGA